MKIVAFAATNAKKSINAQLVKYVASQFENEEIEYLNLNHYEMPLYSVDREEEDGVPQLAMDFAQKIDNADLLLISFAEHNGTYTVAFKNIFDWISRVPNRKAFGDKKIFAMATSGGPRGGKGVLEVAIKRFPFNGGNIVESFSLPKFSENFSLEKGITQPELLGELNQKIDDVKSLFRKEI